MRIKGITNANGVKASRILDASGREIWKADARTLHTETRGLSAYLAEESNLATYTGYSATNVLGRTTFSTSASAMVMFHPSAEGTRQAVYSFPNFSDLPAKALIESLKVYVKVAPNSKGVGQGLKIRVASARTSDLMNYTLTKTQTSRTSATGYGVTSTKTKEKLGGMRIAHLADVRLIISTTEGASATGQIYLYGAYLEITYYE